MADVLFCSFFVELPSFVKMDPNYSNVSTSGFLSIQHDVGCCLLVGAVDMDFNFLSIPKASVSSVSWW